MEKVLSVVAVLMAVAVWARDQLSCVVFFTGFRVMVSSTLFEMTLMDEKCRSL